MARVYTLIRWDKDGHLIEEQWYEYNGPVALCKASAEEKAAARASQQFTEELRRMFQQQFAKQQATLDYLEGQIKPLLESPSGFFAGEEAALRTAATENVSRQYQDAMRGFQNRAFILGGRELPSGAMLQGLGEIEGARAADEAGAQNTITLEGAQRKLANFWNAANVLSGIGSLQSPNALLSGAVSQGAESFKEVQQAFKPSGLLGKILGGIAGGIASVFLPGVGGALLGKLGLGAAAAGAGTAGAASSAGSMFAPAWNPGPGFWDTSNVGFA